MLPRTSAELRFSIIRFRALVSYRHRPVPHRRTPRLSANLQPIQPCQSSPSPSLTKSALLRASLVSYSPARGHHGSVLQAAECGDDLSRRRPGAVVRTHFDPPDCPVGIDDEDRGHRQSRCSVGVDSLQVKP